MLFSTFIEFGTSTIGTMIGYTTSLIGDLSPLLLLIIGVGLALIVFVAVARLFQSKPD
jgi:uncharacterized protein involved in cysteine biosynthesis